jgi:hypothetical protein
MIRSSFDEELHKLWHSHDQLKQTSDRQESYLQQLLSAVPVAPEPPVEVATPHTTSHVDCPIDMDVPELPSVIDLTEVDDDVTSSTLVEDLLSTTSSQLGKRRQQHHADDDQDRTPPITLCGQEVPPPVYRLPAYPNILCLETCRTEGTDFSYRLMCQQLRIQHVERDLSASVVTAQYSPLPSQGVHSDHIDMRISRERDLAKFVQHCQRKGYNFDLIVIDCYDRFQIQEYCGDDKTCFKFYEAYIKVFSECSAPTAAAIIPGHGKHQEYMEMPPIKDLFRQYGLCVEKVHPLHHVLYAVSKMYDLSVTTNYVGQFVYYIQRAQTFAPSVERHNWVVTPNRALEPAPVTHYPPPSLDMWHLSLADFNYLRENGVYCACAEVCRITGPQLCNNYRERRECGYHCTSRECYNRRLVDHAPMHPRLAVKPTTTKGLGLFTHYPEGFTPYKKDDIVGEFCGKVTTSLRRIKGYHCVVELSPGEVYLVCTSSPKDPTRKVQYANHSCDPNCELQIWIDGDGWKRAVVIARYDLIDGVEITIDYNMIASHSEADTRLQCLCGTSKCRQFIESVPLSHSSVVIATVSQPPIVVSAIPADV